jgi:hypothetical protein
MDIKGKRIYDTMKKMNFIRLSTTEGEKSGAKVITDEIKAMGLEPVFEDFKVPCYEIVNVKLEITEPKYMLVEAKGYGYTYTRTNTFAIGTTVTRSFPCIFRFSRTDKNREAYTHESPRRNTRAQE